MQNNHRPTKRSRIEPPLGWMTCNSLTMAPAPYLLGSNEAPVLKTKLATKVAKEIFLDRFRKELVDRFHFSLNSQLRIRPGESTQDAKERRRILAERILVGFSVCTQALQQQDPNSVETSPLQLVILSSDFQPSRFAIHVPVLAQQRGVPLLLLPESSVELGRLLGIRSVGVMAFCAPRGGMHNERTQAEMEIHRAVDSFVTYVATTVI